MCSFVVNEISAPSNYQIDFGQRVRNIPLGDIRSGLAAQKTTVEVTPRQFSPRRLIVVSV